MPDDTEHEYQLADGVQRIVRNDLVLEGDETVTLHEGEAARHDDVLERVDGETESTDTTTDTDTESGSGDDAGETE